jgi:two-component system cell cycle sensor histidine kinase/response regulator CckA
MAERRLSRRVRSPGLLETFRLLAEATREGLALLDAEGRVVVANQALVCMAGPLAGLRPGLPVAPILAAKAREEFAAALATVSIGGQPAVLRAGPADPAAPAEVEWSLRLGALPPGSGPEACLLLCVEDRTERRRAEARLANSARLETIGRLAAGIAHDFNNLLTAILGGAEAVRAAGLPADAEPDLAQIEDAARRGAALVRQLLSFARQQPPQAEVLELNEAVTGLSPLLRRLLGQGVRLELALEMPGRRVRIDPTQLDQVILNLAVNARDAMPKGGTLRIATDHQTVLQPEGENHGQRALPPGRWAVLEVSDTGTGIPPEILPRLFEPFFTTQMEKGGTGLGLATVQGIVTQAGGHVTVESRPGLGTAFRIHLPCREDQAAALPIVAPSVPMAIAAPRTAPLLLVEDEAPLRQLGAWLLERAGHGVVVADSAESALALVDEGITPAALVCDVAMPGLDGLELARRLRARWPGLPVLLLSGYAERTLDPGLGMEGFRFLSKPFGPTELLREVGAVLGGSPSARG